MPIDGKVASSDGAIEHTQLFAGQAFRNYCLLDVYMCSGVQIRPLFAYAGFAHADCVYETTPVVILWYVSEYPAS